MTDAVVECISLQCELSLRRMWTQLRGKFYGFKSNIPRILLTQEEKVILRPLMIDISIQVTKLLIIC